MTFSTLMLIIFRKQLIPPRHSYIIHTLDKNMTLTENTHTHRLLLGGVVGVDLLLPVWGNAVS